MTNIKVLDCTLRDGGYVNNWEFKSGNICKILENLTKAKLDYVECGFLKQIDYSSDRTLFSSIEQLETFLPAGSTKYTLMINYGEYDIHQIPANNKIILRVAFKKDKASEAIEYCRQLKQKGCEIFINPMHTNTYSFEELSKIIKEVNEIKPHGFTIVDTTGSMKANDILKYFYLIDSSLDKDIALCFHSHNNLQLSFSNAQCLLKICKNRDLIIDSCVFGMGRGAGNLCTELLTQYINDNYNGNYDIIPILKVVDEQINPIFSLTPWGYSVPYYLAATNHCHPDYATYLVNRQTVPVEVINELLKDIPDNKKTTYDENLIKQIYLAHQNKSIDDELISIAIKHMLAEKNILILAPGKSLTNEKDKIKTFIENENPFVISLNFVPDEYRTDLVFITNIKRFNSLENTGINTLVTSNITTNSHNCKTIDYIKYINDSDMYDNAALMCLNFLQSIGIKEVNIAGLDGFNSTGSENFYNKTLINTSIPEEFKEKNRIMSEQLNIMNENIRLNFITNPSYEIKKYSEVINK